MTKFIINKKIVIVFLGVLVCFMVYRISRYSEGFYGDGSGLPEVPSCVIKILETEWWRNNNKVFEDDISTFNDCVRNWDVSQVTDMGGMFSGATAFNRSLDNWKVNNVTDMNRMFKGAINFDQPLDNWKDKLGKVSDMHGMFYYATNFNQDISSWDVSNVTDMGGMFSGATNFDQPLDNWKDKLGQVTNMSWMFQWATNFDQDISDWDIRSVTSMAWIFYKSGLSKENAEKIWCSWKNQITEDSVKNQLKDSLNRRGPYDKWESRGKIEDADCSTTCGKRTLTYSWNINNLSGDKKSIFNDCVINWDVSQVTDMSDMFSGATNFNQPLDNWDVSNVTNMKFMFYRAKSFNRSLYSWKDKLGKVENMKLMFEEAKSFDQDISGWDVRSVKDMEGIFYKSGLSKENAEKIWCSWKTQITDLDVKKQLQFSLNHRGPIGGYDGWAHLGKIEDADCSTTTTLPPYMTAKTCDTGYDEIQSNDECKKAYDYFNIYNPTIFEGNMYKSAREKCLPGKHSTDDGKLCDMEGNKWASYAPQGCVYENKHYKRIYINGTSTGKSDRHLKICKKSVCKNTVKGEKYSGNISKTKTGRTCLYWSQRKKSDKRYGYWTGSPGAAAKGVGDHNYCRNPDGEPEPWCYTTDPNKRWEYCNVPMCPT